MQIQDSIHGYIALNNLEERVLDTPQMQRLRRVKQLGFNHLVYPSATHTRFEHSLGAMHLAGTFADALDLDDDAARHLRLAALLHDVGHGPFSHTTDELFHRADTTHEAFSQEKIAESAVADVLQDGGVDPDRVCALIRGEGRLGSIIAGHIDVDRMDYLMRDAYYSGVAYGTIEAETIIRAARLHEDRLVFDGKYVSALESLLTARYLMIAPVYMHRVTLIADAMCQRAVQNLMAAEDVTVADLSRMDDPGLIARLRSCEQASALMDRIDRRDLYTTAATLSRGRDPDRLAEQLRAETGLDADTLLVDEITATGGDPIDVPVATGDRVRPLHMVSPLPDALEHALANTEEIRVYAPEDEVQTVQDAMASI